MEENVHCHLRVQHALRPILSDPREPVHQLPSLQRSPRPEKQASSPSLAKFAQMPMMSRMLGEHVVCSQDYSMSRDIRNFSDLQKCGEIEFELPPDRCSYSKGKSVTGEKLRRKEHRTSRQEQGSLENKSQVSANAASHKGGAPCPVADFNAENDTRRSTKDLDSYPKVYTTSQKLRSLDSQFKEKQKALLVRKRVQKLLPSRPLHERMELVDSVVEEIMTTNTSTNYSTFSEESASDCDDVVQLVRDTLQVNQLDRNNIMNETLSGDIHSELHPKKIQEQELAIESPSAGKHKNSLYSRLGTRRKRTNQPSRLMGIHVNSCLFQPHLADPEARNEKPVVFCSNIVEPVSNISFENEPIGTMLARRRTLLESKLSLSKNPFKGLPDVQSDQDGQGLVENSQAELGQEPNSPADKFKNTAASNKGYNKLDNEMSLNMTISPGAKRSPLPSDCQRTLSTAEAQRLQFKSVLPSSKHVMSPEYKDGPCKQPKGSFVSKTSDDNVRLRPLNEQEVAKVKSMTRNMWKKDVVLSIVEEARIKLRGDDFARLRGNRWLNDEVMNSFVALINARNRDFFKKEMKEKFAGFKASHTIEYSSTSWPYADRQLSCAFFKFPRPRTYVFNTFFFTRLVQGGYDYRGVRNWMRKAGHHVKDLDLILVPINLSNVRWVLVSIDLRSRLFTYMDFMSRQDSIGVLDSLKNWLVDEVRDKVGDDAVKKMDIEKWCTVMNPAYLPRQRHSGSCGIFALYTAECLERGKHPDFNERDILTMRQRTVLFLKNSYLPS